MRLVDLSKFKDILNDKNVEMESKKDMLRIILKYLDDLLITINRAVKQGQPYNNVLQILEEDRKYFSEFNNF